MVAHECPQPVGELRGEATVTEACRRHANQVPREQVVTIAVIFQGEQLVGRNLRGHNRIDVGANHDEHARYSILGRRGQISKRMCGPPVWVAPGNIEVTRGCT